MTLEANERLNIKIWDSPVNCADMAEWIGMLWTWPRLTALHYVNFGQLKKMDICIWSSEVGGRINTPSPFISVWYDRLY